MVINQRGDLRKAIRFRQSLIQRLKRGNIELFIKCAEWLERRLPGCLVYYGHDVDDENLRLFDKPARDELLRHYLRSRK
jgi:hypothetical protein